LLLKHEDIEGISFAAAIIATGMSLSTDSEAAISSGLDRRPASNIPFVVIITGVEPDGIWIPEVLLGSSCAAVNGRVNVGYSVNNLSSILNEGRQ
jgi:hypothetical protein